TTSWTAVPANGSFTNKTTITVATGTAVIKLYDHLTASSSIIEPGDAFNIHTNFINAGTANFTGDFTAAIFTSANVFVSYIDTKTAVFLPAGVNLASGINF